MLVVVFTIAANSVKAQLPTIPNVTVLPPVLNNPSPYLSDWQSRASTATVIVNNATGASLDCKIWVEFFLNGSRVAYSQPAKLPLTRVQPGSNSFNGGSLVPLNSVHFENNVDQNSQRAGRIPDGQVCIIVHVLDPRVNKESVSPNGCAMIFSYSPPNLILPLDGSLLCRLGENNVIDKRNNSPVINFQWTPVNPAPPQERQIVKYHFAIYEVLPGQDKIAAFRGARPIFQTGAGGGIPDLLGQTSLIWPTQYFLPEKGKTYVWSVRALDNRGNPLVLTNDGWATPFTFSVPLDCDQGDHSSGKISLVDNGKTVGKTTDNNLSNDNKIIDKNFGNGKKTVKDNKPPPPPRDTSSCGACNPVILTDTSIATSDIAINDTIKVGKFDMIVTNVTSGSPSSASGKGTIKISWLFSSVLVDFSNLKVSGAHEMISGDVATVNDPNAPAFPQQLGINTALSNAWSKSKIASLDSYLKLNGKVSSAANQLVQPLSTPIGVSNYKGFTLCISEIQFTKDHGILTAVTSIPIVSYDDTLSFGVTNLPFCPAGLTHKGTLELLQDFTLHGASPNENSFKVALKAKSSSREGCYVSWNCTSFDTLSLDLDIIFPRTWLVPKPDNDQVTQVIASFSAKTVKWKDWMLKGNLVPCTIVGTNGVGMEITNLALDLSDGENPSGIVFPAKYLGTQGSDFKGLFAENITLTMPDGWRTFDDPDKAPTFSAKNLIISKTGLTADFIAANVVQFPKGDIARMSASLDTVVISLVNTSLTQAYVKGKINLPVGEADQQSSLVYKALFNVSQKKFDFTLKPDKDITTNLFAGAKLTIKETSLLSITLSKTEKKFSITLNGSVGWSDQEITVPATSKKIKINLAPSFENVQLIYDDNASPKKITFNKGTWSFASPQKKLAGFPISLKNISIETQPTTGTELCAAALKFDLTVNLDSNKIGADGTFRIIGAIDKSTGDSKFKFKPKFKDFIVDKITVNANLAAVKIVGTLEFYNSDAKWGDGFYATIKATFTSMQLELSANARFGMKTDYRYWYVEAKAILPTGIPFMTGYAFYGAGVAAWYHINADMTGAKPNATASSMTSASSGAVMSPDKNIGLGFKVLAVLGTTPDPSKMNADIALAAQFSPSGGIMNLGLSGQLWLMAKFTERATAPVIGTMNVSYDFPNKIFDLNASVTINKAPITGSGTLKVNVNGTTGKWYVKIGDPINRVTLTVAVLGTVTSHSYFMFGNNITPPSTFMSTTIAGLVRAGCSINNSMLSSATNSVKSGPGLATGFEIGFAANGNINIAVATINWNASAGAEANLSLLRYDGTPCPSFTGYNRWYVRGSIAVYGGVTVTMHVSPWNVGGGRIYHPCCGNPFKSCFYDWSCYDNLPVVCLHCCGSGCNYNLATLNIGAYLNGGFPNPSWVEGSVSGNYNLLGGLISGSFSANFSKGNKCTP